MKKLTVNDARTVRETAAEYKGKPFVVSMGAHTIRIGLKGGRRAQDFEVAYDQIYSRGAKNAANIEMAEAETISPKKPKTRLVRRGKLA